MTMDFQKQEGRDFQFDFGAAVAAARRDYPVETENVTFVDLASPEARSQLQEWFGAASRTFLASCASAEEVLGVKAGRCEIDAVANKRLLIFNSKLDTSFFGAPDLASAVDFVFNHELGHLVVDNGLPSVNGDVVIRPIAESEAGNNFFNQAEMAADCFAVLRGLSRGIITIEEARRFSFYRGIAAGLQHATAPGLDAMMMAAEERDLDFSGLTLEEVKNIPAFYAEKYSARQGENTSLDVVALFSRFSAVEVPVSVPELAESPISRKTSFLKSLKSGFKAIAGRKDKKEPLMHEGLRTRTEWRTHTLTNQEWLENLADVCEHSPDNSFAFHVTAKTASVILATGKEPRTGKDFDVTDKKWDKVREDLKHRADKIGARHLIFKPA